jgi:hypothetical protein
MNSLIKYGLYFVVAFSVLAFGAAEVWAWFFCLLNHVSFQGVRRKTREDERYPQITQITQIY